MVSASARVDVDPLPPGVYHGKMLSATISVLPLPSLEYIVANNPGGSFTPSQLEEIRALISQLKASGRTDVRTIGGHVVAAFPNDPVPPPQLYPGVFAPHVPQPFDPAVLEEARRRGSATSVTTARILAATGPVKNEDGATVMVQDFYNFETVALTPVIPGAAAAGPNQSYIVLAGRALKVALGGGAGRLTAAIWGSLPSIVRTTLTQLGIGVGAMIAFNGDIPFITLPGQGNSIEPFIGPQPLAPGAPASNDLAVQIGGTWDGRVITNVWVANNMLFWATGSRGDNLMHWVRRKNGSVKGWRPPKPVVLMPGGAKNLRDFVKAANILDKQGAQLQKVLRKRSPPPRKEAKPKVVTIVEGHATGVLT